MSDTDAPIETKAARIKELEHEADKLTHSCVIALQKTFITPFDRSQIHELIRRLDDVMDSINDGASRMVLYDLQDVRLEAKQLAEVILESSKAIGQGLTTMRHLKDEKAIRDTCIKVHRLENDADEILRTALRHLFSEELHPYLVIKWKEVFEHLEKATDRCEDVADIIQGVILEAS